LTHRRQAFYNEHSNLQLPGVTNEEHAITRKRRTLVKFTAGDSVNFPSTFAPDKIKEFQAFIETTKREAEDKVEAALLELYKAEITLLTKKLEDTCDPLNIHATLKNLNPSWPANVLWALQQRVQSLYQDQKRAFDKQIDAQIAAEVSKLKKDAAKKISEKALSVARAFTASAAVRVMATGGDMEVEGAAIEEAPVTREEMRHLSLTLLNFEQRLNKKVGLSLPAKKPKDLPLKPTAAGSKGRSKKDEQPQQSPRSSQSQGASRSSYHQRDHVRDDRSRSSHRSQSEKRSHSRSQTPPRRSERSRSLSRSFRDGLAQLLHNRREEERGGGRRREEERGGERRREEERSRSPGQRSRSPVQRSQHHERSQDRTRSRSPVERVPEREQNRSRQGTRTKNRN
jgi:hypothetical protein